MNLEESESPIGPTIPRDFHSSSSLHSGQSSPNASRSRRWSSTPAEDDRASSFTLPPLPSLRRAESQSETFKSPEYLRQRAGSGAYYAAAWGSPYATPSPRRSPRVVRHSGHSHEVDLTPPYLPIRQPAKVLSSSRLQESTATQKQDNVSERKRVGTTRRLRNAISERPNWLSESEESGSNTSAASTPTREAYLDTWGISGVDFVPPGIRKHRVNESVATITPDTFHDSEIDPVRSESQHRQLSPSRENSMAEDRGSVDIEDRRLPVLPRRVSTAEGPDRTHESPASSGRPRPSSMQSYQRPKKKVVWRGKACIIALPLTDRQAAGLPPLLTAQEIKDRIQGWIAAGYRVDGFEPPVEGNGQSRPVYPDPADMQAERKLRHYQVHLPDQAEWDSWVDFLKEEKLRMLGVSPSNSEALPPTKSPFPTTLSRGSSGHPGLPHSPPIVPSSAGSIPIRTSGHPFSPSLMSSAGISPQPPSLTSSQYSVLPKAPHGYKQSVALPNAHGRITSPFEPVFPQTSPFGTGARPNIQPLSSRQNSFSPNHPLHLPNLGEILSPVSQPRGVDVRGPQTNFMSDSAGRNPIRSPGYVAHSQNLNQNTPAPRMPTRVDSLDQNGPSRPPIEIAHPKPKSHRQNLSLALQREIDEAEAALHAKEGNTGGEATEDFDRFARKSSAMDESLHEEPPILRRPETMTDEGFEIETNPSIAATPMLMDDKSPFVVNWQALSDAAKAEPQTTDERRQPTSKFNVEAKEFDPRAGFSSTNFSFGGDSFAPFGPPTSAPAHPNLRPAVTSSTSSVSRLNVEAPAFTPSFMSQTVPNETPFQFSSATFNVAGATFLSVRPTDVDFKRSVSFPVGGTANSPDSIFGKVVIDPASKVSRRTSKGVPIVMPKAKNGQEAESGSESQSESESDPEEEDGRPMAPTDRQKRARRRNSDGDRSPVFATSAPFNHSRILSEIVDNVDADGPNPGIPQKPVDGWSYIQADKTQLESKGDIVSGQEKDGAARHSESEFTFGDQQDAAKFNEARPLDTDGRAASEEDVQAETAKDVKQEVPSSDEPSPAVGQAQKPTSSLSALARPFEFKILSSSLHTSSANGTPQKPQGLEVSRHAVPPSPKESSREVSASLSSPPAELYHYTGGQDISDSDVDVVQVFEESTTENDAVPRRERECSLQQQSEAGEPVHRTEAEQFETKSPQRQPHDEAVPSFEEIDAVMKQFEVHPELGIERTDTPLRSTPLVDSRLGRNFRSDAPSPSLSRSEDNKRAESEKSYAPSLGRGIEVDNLNPDQDDVGDWGETLPAKEEAKPDIRSEFFDGHVKDLVGGLLEDRLAPLERTLQVIQHSLAVVATGTRPKNRRHSTSNELKNSDADDEDDYDAFEGFPSYRTRSPATRREGRQQERIRAAVAEALAAYQPPPAPPQPSIDMTEIQGIVQEMRQLAQQAGSQDTQAELKTIVEDVISHHPRLRGSRVHQDHEATEMKYKPQIDGLESMLKISQEHAAEEARLRRQAEQELNEVKLRLRIAEEEAAQYREASEEAQQSLQAFIEEKESYKSLEQDVDALSLKNAALETTLEEYRVSSDQWREDIRSEREKNKELKETLRYLRQQLEDQSHSRQNLRTKLDRVQAHMTQVVHDLHAEQAEWREKEHDLLNRLSLLQTELEHERRHREKAEVDLDTLNKEHQTYMHFRSALEQSQQEVSRLNELLASLKEENRALDTKAFNLDRELAHVISSKDAELATSTAKLQAELDSTIARLESIRTDSEAQISRLQSRLDHAELDIEDQKAKHDALMSETIEAHKEALREANEKRESALEDQHHAHEKKLNDLRDRHTRELHNSFDNRTRLEHHLNEKLSLSDDRVRHLESKVADLEERLEITRSAAKAAAEAATAKGINVPTPAPSVIASPPQRASSASMSFPSGSDVPEKISPQALRESIMVLQDQLQNREQKIEKLESELAAVDKEAPNKVKQRDTEISWLRELLNVRIDDLEDIINMASQPDLDKDSVKDAAIRLKANLQMEQQLKERVASSSASGLTSQIPALAALSNYAQSPRALPMAAAAAWGNWRRVRETSIGALSDLASNISSQTQTPSKSTVGSPASFLSGIMTPPSTSQRGVSGGEPRGLGRSNSNELPIPPPSMRPLAAAAAAAQARKGSSPAEAPRPLRAWNSQPRSLSSRQQEPRRVSGEPLGKRRESLEMQNPKRRESSESKSHSQSSLGPGAGAVSSSDPASPRTPTPALERERAGRPQPNMNMNLDLTDDVDDDASLLDSTATETEHEHEHEHLKPEPHADLDSEPPSISE
ncbi:hypothetical protein A1O1_06495 [Capronia coronata CBS 617.96]|uniref:Myosin class II heavy chain n=1 Tax=Capronia coronata CBS 617.96 TaxID=1182541 RepID=W9Y902_9EURO|nr:uncharacterized protein A1O1_06495 [Capronia coronata CBS 617.96]EXJ86125.1 hypothetical protein A1O1_06495 [Capronia coronata CBS 617.96]